MVAKVTTKEVVGVVEAGPALDAVHGELLTPELIVLPAL